MEKNLPELKIMYDNNGIKQLQVVEYLGCYLDVNLNGKFKAVKSLKKINAKLQLLYRRNDFVNPKYPGLLCNSVIQPHIDYAYISWYPLVRKKNEKENASYSKNMYPILLKTWLKASYRS